MTRKTVLLLAVIGVVVTAGCVGSTTTPTPEEEPVDTPTADNSTPAPTPGENETTDFMVKQAIVAEYEPGACDGMPSIVTEEEINSTLEQKEELVDKICESTNLTESDQTKLYGIVQQHQQVQISEQSDGTYAFTVTDAECCRVTTIEGEYNPDTETFSVTNQTTETQPC